MSADGDHKPKSNFRLLDITALIVGYALASLLVRAFWPRSDEVSLVVGIAIFILYGWLGLAMSGPIVMLTVHRPNLPDRDPDALPLNRTWAELAWLIIGFYWIALTMLVVPLRTPTHRLRDSAVLGIFPIIAAICLRLVGPRVTGRPTGSPSWTHTAAIGLLLTWPIVWIVLILLGKSIL